MILCKPMSARRRKWNDQELRKAVETSSSLRKVIHALGLIPAGGNYEQIKKHIQERNLDISHFNGKGWRLGSTIPTVPAKSLQALLRKNTFVQSFKLKKRLFSEGLKNAACELCGWAGKSSDGRVPVELDHINGDRNDNRLKNLQILCPNCHSLQPTHRGRNIKRRDGGMVYARHLKCREL